MRIVLFSAHFCGSARVLWLSYSFAPSLCRENDLNRLLVRINVTFFRCLPASLLYDIPTRLLIYRMILVTLGTDKPCIVHLTRFTIRQDRLVNFAFRSQSFASLLNALINFVESTMIRKIIITTPNRTQVIVGIESVRR